MISNALGLSSDALKAQVSQTPVLPYRHSSSRSASWFRCCHFISPGFSGQHDFFKVSFMVLMGGVFLTFIASFIVSFIEPSIGLPFISPFAGTENGQPMTVWGWAGLGFNILVLGIAAMGLIMDFKLCENIVDPASAQGL